MINWILSLGSIAGGIFCVFKKPAGWYIWSVVDIGWMAYCLHHKQYPEFAMWTVFLGVCIFGIYEWRKKK